MKKAVFVLLTLALGLSASAGTISNDTLAVDFCGTNGAFSVTDLRTGRVWTQLADEHALTVERVVSAGENELSFEATARGVKGVLRGRVALEGETVRAELDAPAASAFDRADAALVGWPCGFAARKGDRILMPHGAGFSFPADQTNLGERFDWRMHGYSREWRMAMWGQYSERIAADGEVLPQDGYLAIVETPCNTVGTYLKRANGLMGFQLLWEGDLGTWGHKRRVRFEFMTKAGPMEMALRYRGEMKRKGYYKTFAEKAKERPQMAGSFRKIAGAPSVWYWAVDGKKAEVCRTLREECGFGDFLFQFAARKDLGTWVTPEEVAACAKAAPGVLLSEYDMYMDTMDSKYIPLIAYMRPYWSTDAADNGDVIRLPDGTLRRGWKVAFKGDADGAAKGIGCATVCEQKIAKYVRKRLASELKKTPEYNARYLDGMGCIEPFECYDPNHRMSRRECVERRREMMAIPGREFNLIASTEDGPDYLASVCDYFTCGFSAANDYRVDGGWWMWNIYDGEPPDEIRRGTDETTRIPIFEMVYHGCCVSYWDWCDYNNKFPKIWWKRDLFNALCGTPPLYFFNEDTWPRFRGQLKASYDVATPVAIATYSTPMTAYRILTPDRRVHRVEFANGVAVTVNFGETPYRTKDGETLTPRSHILHGVNR